MSARLLVTLVLAASAAWVEAAAEPVSWRHGWSLTGLAGPLTTRDSSEIFFGAEWDTVAGSAGLAVSKEAFRWADRASFEVEGQVFQRVGGMELWEASALAVARWRDFPWNDRLSTSLAAGYGPSYASDVPASVLDGDGDLPGWLGMLMVEASFAPSEDSAWALVARYQHRSSTFGLFGGNGSQDETTAVLLGVKWRFGGRRDG